MVHKSSTSRDEFLNISRKTILIVEDEALVRFPVAEFLRESEFEVLEVASADEAIALLNSEIHCDLILSDFQTPGTLDGVMLARLLKHKKPELPVILSSSDPSVALSTERCFFLAKPYPLIDLLTVINKILTSKLL